MRGRAIATGKVTKVLALPLFARLVLAVSTFSQGKEKFHFTQSK